ncbi:MAG: integrase core domain-containing protein [Pseudomonadota bacterium]|nr:integrase core domain-containing protein [Pseudomonadota bacterium]
MTNTIQPFHLLVIALVGWLNRHQQAIIDYLIEENRVLKEQIEGQRLRFTDDQRIRLAVKAKVLGRRLLDELETLVTPDTLLTWHRKLIAQKWTYTRKGRGRPRIAQEITDLVLRMARENVSWGYDRIQGALANLGRIIAPNTVKNILKRHGIEPAPEREKHTSWTTFLKAHWEVMAATDFFTVEVWTPRGLVTHYVLFIIHLSTRSVHIAGVTTAPNSAFMKQMARNLTDVSDGFLLNSRYLIMDRDTKYTAEFRGHLDREGVKPVRCPARAPNCNAFAERFVRSIKEECLDRMILFGEASLRRALREYVVHYQTERNHQGVGNRLLEPLAMVSSNDETIHRRERLGGMLNYYCREAA